MIQSTSNTSSAISTDSQTKLSKTTIILHWVVALSIISLVSVGLFMSEYEVYSLYPIHKSIGMLIFLVIITRIVWRLKNGWPIPVSDGVKIEILLAKAVHWILIICTALFPISDMIMSGAGGHGLSIFGLDLLAANYDPVTHKAISLNETIAGLGHSIHEILGYVIIIAVTLHVAGALKHHFIVKDRTLRPMLNKD